MEFCCYLLHTVSHYGAVTDIVWRWFSSVLFGRAVIMQCPCYRTGRGWGRTCDCKWIRTLRMHKRKERIVITVIQDFKTMTFSLSVMFCVTFYVTCMAEWLGHKTQCKRFRFPVQNCQTFSTSIWWYALSKILIPKFISSAHFVPS